MNVLATKKIDMSSISRIAKIAWITAVLAWPVFSQETCVIHGDVREHVWGILDAGCKWYDSLAIDWQWGVIASSRADMESIVSCYRAELKAYTDLNSCAGNPTIDAYLTSTPEWYWDDLQSTIDVVNLQKQMLFPEERRLDWTLMAEWEKIEAPIE